MTSGRENYFRHSFYSIDNEKIQMAIEKLGFEGYAYYFILLELVYRKYKESGEKVIRIHPQSLRNVWRKQTKSCNKVLEKLQECGLFSYTFTELFIEFYIPNLPRFIGKYKSEEDLLKLKLEFESDSKLESKSNLAEDSRAEKRPDPDFLFNQKPEVRELINFWNEQKLFKQDLAPHALVKIQNGLSERLGFYKLEEIKQAIENYAKIYHDEKLSSHKYSLYEFLNSDKTFKFFPNEFDEGRFVEKTLNPADREKAALEKLKQDLAESRATA